MKNSSSAQQTTKLERIRAHRARKRTLKAILDIQENKHRRTVEQGQQGRKENLQLDNINNRVIFLSIARSVL